MLGALGRGSFLWPSCLALGGQLWLKDEDMTDARGRASGAGGLVGAWIGNEELHDWTRGARREVRARCAFAGWGSSRELAARVGPCGKGMRGVGNSPAKARRFGRHIGVRAEGVGRERDVATLEGSGGARPPGSLRGLDAEGNGEPSAGEARGPGFGECHSNCMGGRWWGRGAVGAVGEAAGS